MEKKEPLLTLDEAMKLFHKYENIQSLLSGIEFKIRAAMLGSFEEWWKRGFIARGKRLDWTDEQIENWIDGEWRGYASDNL